MDEVLVAADDIPMGMVVGLDMFAAERVHKSCILEGAIGPEDSGLLEGKVAAQYIAKNGQIIMEYFRDRELCLESDESVYVIKPDWIDMRSSALRRGDLIDIYGTGGLGLLGTFRIAYVKDAAEREVENAEGTASARDGNSILERPNGTSTIDHIEIISTFQKYQKLTDIVLGAGGLTPAALIIVQRGEL